MQDISVSVAPGELVGITGPNGSGKTALFNLVAGGLAPDGGEIRFAGLVISGLAPHRVSARGMARTFQIVRPFVGLTALENVLVGRLYGAEHHGLSEAVPASDRLLTLVGLDGKGHLRADQLTLIDRKRLELPG